jgi:quinol monooxygenase YgiN
MIHVLATIELAEGVREKFLGEFHRIISIVRDEDGCIEYGPAIDLKTSVSSGEARENVVTVIEKWTSVPALEAHLKAPHMASYRDRVKDMVRDVKIHVLAPG